MSLPTLSPTRALGDYLWEFAVECADAAERWADRQLDAAERMLLLSHQLLAAEAEIAECRAGLYLAGRWSYQTDSFRDA